MHSILHILNLQGSPTLHEDFQNLLNVVHDVIFVSLLVFSMFEFFPAELPKSL